MLFSRSQSCLVFLIFFSGALLTLRLGNTHFWDQDEGYYASVAREMFERGDWVVPTFNQQLFGHKPPLMYWGMMVGFHAFGVNEAGARIVSSLFGVGTVLLTYCLGKLLFGQRTGLFSAIALSSSLMFVLVSRSATADSHLTFLVLLSLFVWISGYRSASGSQRNEKLRTMGWKPWTLTYAVMGVSVLTKGPIGFLFPTAVIGLFLLTEVNHSAVDETSKQRQGWRQAVRAYLPASFFYTVWRMRPFMAVALITAIAGPWYLLVQMQTQGEFLREFIGVHHLGRFSQAMDNHSGPFYYYLLACLIGLFPWSSFAIPAALHWISPADSTSTRQAIRFISCWAGVYLVIFSLASTKLPNYVLPAYPALAIALGRYFSACTSDSRSVHRGWHIAGWSVFISIGVLILTVVPALSLWRRDDQTTLDRILVNPELHATLTMICIAGVPMVLFGVIGLLQWHREKYVLSAGLFSSGAAILIVYLSHFVAPAIDRVQAAPRLSHAWHQMHHSNIRSVQVLGYFRPSLVFYFGRPVVFADQLGESIKTEPASEKLLIIPERQLEQVREQLPSGMQVLGRFAQFTQGDEIVIMGDGSLMR
jgi:4-amino-4-deoxy-L-arabinose transferase-like glycosyltransferase